MFTTSYITKALQKFYHTKENIHVYSGTNAKFYSESINRGRCFNWAFLAYKTYGGKLCSVKNYGGHAFVKINGRYHDSETPRGVKDWRKLGIYKRKNQERVQKLGLTFMNEQTFIKYWKNMGNCPFIDIHKELQND